MYSPRRMYFFLMCALFSTHKKSLLHLKKFNDNPVRKFFCNLFFTLFPSSHSGHPKLIAGLPENDAGYPPLKSGLPAANLGHPGSSCGHPENDLGLPARDLGCP